MSQQKTNAQKVFSETKIFTNFKIKNKMKNLKNLNLVELNAQEVKKIEGGFFGPFRAGLTLAYRQIWGLTFPKDYYLPEREII